MAIYVGENNALLLKDDRSVVEFYKGNKKIFGYTNSKQGEIITSNNVNPIEHKLKVKLLSDTITDFSTVNVTRCGKNLFDADTVLPSLESPSYPNYHWEKQADGSWYLNAVAFLKGCKWYQNTRNYKGQIAISITAKCPRGTAEGSVFYTICKYTDGTSDLISVKGKLSDFETFTLLSDPNKIVDYISQSYNYNYDIYVKDIMIAYGTDTDYEPYNPQKVIANADGTVEGLMSLSPNMTIFSDSDDAMIHLSYC